MKTSKMTGNKSGTKYYLPPEIFQGKILFKIFKEKMVLAGAIDIWSLGVTLYYFIHGKLPFYSKNPQDFKEILINKE